MTTGPESSSSTHLLGRALIACFLLAFAATSIAVWWYGHRQLSAMEEEVIQELTGVSGTKSRQITNWRDERLGDGRVLMAAPIMRLLPRILSGNATTADRADLTDVITRLQAAFQYSGGALCGPDGKLLLVSGSFPVNQARARELVAQAVRKNDVLLSDLFIEQESGQPLMALSVPAGSSGALIMNIDPSRFLYPYLRAWSGHSQTAETLLVRRDGDGVLYLSKLRYHADAPLRFRRSLANQSVPPDEVLDFGSMLRGDDYRGVPVISIIRRIPESGWYLVTKIDAAEADAAERRLGWEMAVITALIAIANVAVVVLVWRGQRERIREERAAWFQAIANDTPAYLWMATPGEENSFINTPFARFLGTERSSLSKAWTDYVHPEDVEQARANLQESLRTQSEYAYEFRIRRQDGEYRWVVSKAVPRFSSAGTFLGFAGSLLDITGRRLAEQKLREANENLARELSESMRKEQEIENLSERLIDGQEEERKRLARELHDDLSQQIAALSISTGNLKRQIPAERTALREMSDRIHDKLVQLAEMVRRMSHELHPAVLQHAGLAAAFRSHCGEFGALTGVRVVLDIQGSFDGLAPAVAICMFRVTQEALRNVAKHARIAEASVGLRREDGWLYLEIADKGGGFDRASASAKAGLGLSSIQERVRIVRGKVEIQTAPGQGTRVMVRVPETGRLDHK